MNDRFDCRRCKGEGEKKSGWFFCKSVTCPLCEGAGSFPRSALDDFQFEFDAAGILAGGYPGEAMHDVMDKHPMTRKNEMGWYLLYLPTEKGKEIKVVQVFGGRGSGRYEVVRIEVRTPKLPDWLKVWNSGRWVEEGSFEEPVRKALQESIDWVPEELFFRDLKKKFNESLKEKNERECWD